MFNIIYSRTKWQKVAISRILSDHNIGSFSSTALWVNQFKASYIDSGHSGNLLYQFRLSISLYNVFKIPVLVIVFRSPLFFLEPVEPGVIALELWGLFHDKAVHVWRHLDWVPAKGSMLIREYANPTWELSEWKTARDKTCVCLRSLRVLCVWSRIHRGLQGICPLS